MEMMWIGLLDLHDTTRSREWLYPMDPSTSKEDTLAPKNYPKFALWIETLYTYIRIYIYIWHKYRPYIYIYTCTHIYMHIYIYMPVIYTLHMTYGHDSIIFLHSSSHAVHPWPLRTRRLGLCTAESYGWTLDQARGFFFLGGSAEMDNILIY